MKHTAAPIALRARLVFPITQPPLADGVITLDGDRIVAIGENRSGAAPRDLGDVALLPGLVNAHTHLEFSELTAPLGEPGMAFPAWIRAVVSRRRAAMQQADTVLADSRRAHAIESGICQCLESGTTTVGDIATWDMDGAQFAGRLRATAFRERIGLSEHRVEEQIQAAAAALATADKSASHYLLGLSPHAPYTAAPRLVTALAELSGRHRISLAMHLAESPEELQLLAAGDGPFRELLQDFDIWNGGVFPGRRTPLDYLQMLAAAHRSLVVHGNYLDAAAWKLLASRRDSMSVVYCPRTHAYFQHAPYPLHAMLKAGVRVAVGTDGRASNPDLNVFRELQFAAVRHPNVEPQRLLRMVTLDAAEALGCAEQIGSLECGKGADLTVIRLGTTSGLHTEPYDALLHNDSAVAGVWRAGTQT